MNKFIMLIIVVLMIIIITLFWIYARYKLNYWKRRGIEHLKGGLIFGNVKNAMLFRTSPGWHIGKLHKAARTDAPFVGFYIFHKPCLLLRDPNLIKQLLIQNFDVFHNRHFGGSKQKDSVGNENLFGVRNALWNYLRSKISPFFTKAKLKRMFPFMMEIGKPMMDYLETYPANPDGVKIVDIQDVSYKFTTDLFASLALGVKMDSFHCPNEEFTVQFGKFIHGYRKMIALLTLFFTPELLNLIGTKHLVNSSFIRKIFWNSIKNREKNGERRNDFMDSLLSLKYGVQNPDYKFENENLFYQSSTFLAFESSATCISFTLKELANYPKYQNLAREDVNRAIDTYGWTFKAIHDMKYLDQTISEGLRLYPPVSFIDRYANNDYQIPNTDIVIEKGTPIFVSMFGLGWDPRYWDEPEVFNPDRFAEGNRIPDAYMPFGIGPKICIGQTVAKIHVKIVMALLLHNYEIWQIKENECCLDSRSILTIADRAIKLHFKKIENLCE